MGRGFHRKYLVYVNLYDPDKSLRKFLEKGSCKVTVLDYLVEQLIYDRENNN